MNSLFEDRIYCAWNDNTFNPFDIVFTYSTDGGATWVTPVDISTPVIPLPIENLGVNIQTGPQGQVYVCWSAIDDYQSNIADNTRIYFNKSLDGGVTWLANPVNIATVQGLAASKVNVP